jgi:hypothetical protein
MVFASSMSLDVEAEIAGSRIGEELEGESISTSGVFRLWTGFAMEPHVLVGLISSQLLLE